jgi:hypothetical protein
MKAYVIIASEWSLWFCGLANSEEEIMERCIADGLATSPDDCECCSCPDHDDDDDDDGFDEMRIADHEMNCQCHCNEALETFDVTHGCSKLLWLRRDNEEWWREMIDLVIECRQINRLTAA